MADQLGGGAGGGRFSSDFLRALLNEETSLQRLQQVILLRTQAESTSVLGKLPANVELVSRRFPSRLRGSRPDALFAKTVPKTDVGHGLFYYVFPGQGRASLITLHDLSMFHPGFHPAGKRRRHISLLKNVLARCDRIVVDTDTIKGEFQNRWPQYADRCVRISPGVSLPTMQGTTVVERTISDEGPYILAVGTIEPRKNYDRLLDAYELLVSRMRSERPQLVVIGREGWSSEATSARLAKLAAQQRIRWLRSVDDDELSWYYRHAAVFTYLSVYEGWGYPPFEAALAGVPLVLTSASSVGELWAGSACCVDPLDIEAIVAAWQWALELSRTERSKVSQQQSQVVDQFPWSRCISTYIDLYEQLAA